MAIERGENKVNIKHQKFKEEKKLVKQKKERLFIEEIRKNYYTYSIIIFLTFLFLRFQFGHISHFNKKKKKFFFREMNEMKQVI